MRIQSNSTSKFVQNRYNQTNSNLNKTLQKLSSGYKINQAADDAAGLAISEKMKSQIKGLDQAYENIQDGINLTNVAEGALGNIQNPNLVRARELLIQAANDTLTSEDKALIQEEINQTADSINDIVENTEYNNIKLLIPPTTFTPDLRPGTNGKADIIFIIDKTGSMGDSIQNVKNNTESFMSSLKAFGVDANLGLAAYGDINEGSNSIIEYGFPLDTTAFQGSLSSLQASGGGDEPESGLEGIQKALSYPLRNDATKNFILITDASVHQKGTDNLSNYTINDTIDQLKASGISLTVVTNSFAKSQLSPLATETGGLTLDIDGMFGDQLLTLAEKITNESGGTFTSEDMNPIVIQAGANEGQQILIPLYDHRDFRLQLRGISLDTYDSVMEGLNRIDNLSEKISNRRSIYGALSNGLEHASNVVSNTSENLSNAMSKITDTDMAKEMSELKKDQVLLQSVQSMMTQVNQMSQGILNLLK